MMSEKTIRGVAYARFSSDGQRDESIDAQLRAIDAYAVSHGIVLVSQYIDRARSAMTADRPSFQSMISDAAKGLFDVIIVHKLDRFARNRYDSARYKHQINRYGIRLLSVSENLDGSPESIVLESVLEGMAEYYSQNLAREVEKGKLENALKGRHVGGIPPLGYDVDKATMKLTINPVEAEAVKLIFQLYLKGAGYGQIINELNARGHKTKKGNPFGKGSLYEILRNEKYTGVYIYNRTSSKTPERKYNRHLHKSDEDIIRVESAVPTIINPADFDLVQQRMNERRHKAAKYTAKQFYLLSGKIICGECGSAYVGNSRKANEKNPLYTSYRCGKKHSAIQCDNPEVKRDSIEALVLNQLAEHVFGEAALPRIIAEYDTYRMSIDAEYLTEESALVDRLRSVDKAIESIVNVLMTTGSTALSDKLTQLETDKVSIEHRLATIRLSVQRSSVRPSAEPSRCLRMAPWPPDRRLLIPS